MNDNEVLSIGGEQNVVGNRERTGLLSSIQIDDSNFFRIGEVKNPEPTSTSITHIRKRLVKQQYFLCTIELRGGVVNSASGLVGFGDFHYDLFVDVNLELVQRRLTIIGFELYNRTGYTVGWYFIDWPNYLSRG